MPWEENLKLKPAQAIPTPSFMQKAQEGVQKVVDGVKSMKMPWDEVLKEKPRPSLPMASQGDVRKAEPTTLSSFLAKMEGVESGGNPEAKNPESTATGLHQFTAGTWKETVAAMGKDYSLADRKDPKKSREVAEFFTNQNVKAAKSDLGRAPSELDLYVYHFLGKGAAGGFLKAPRDEPATDYVSSAVALKNKAVFYKGSKPRTVGEVLDKFGRKF